MTFVPVKNKKNRQLVMDPTLLQRYEYIRRYLFPGAKPLANTYSQGNKDTYKRVLLICWQKNSRQWMTDVI
jgi:hypothetical protein